LAQDFAGVRSLENHVFCIASEGDGSAEQQEHCEAARILHALVFGAAVRD
jgi:hypothetical protein